MAVRSVLALVRAVAVRSVRLALAGAVRLVPASVLAVAVRSVPASVLAVGVRLVLALGLAVGARWDYRTGRNVSFPLLRQSPGRYLESTRGAQQIPETTINRR